MADNSLNFTIRVRDEATGQLHTISMSADEVKNALKGVNDQGESLSNRTINWAALTQGLDAVKSSISQFNAAFGEMVAGAQEHQVVETKLQTIMAQRMQATDADVKSINDLIAAQTKLGVIGGDVQRSGAQQLATFLNQRQSLETLIPAMNNLVAQQNGVNASSQDATSIGNMMGKAMQGQTEVLQRVGITFTDAQKEIIKYGDESQRAATLAQVITDNVGNMNEKIAETDAGKQKQLANEIGGIKKQIGALVQGAMPYVTIISETLIAISSTVQLASTIKGLNSILKVTAISNIAVAASERITAQARILASAVTGQAIVTTNALRIATIALTAAYTMGLSLAIMAITEAISYFMGQTDEQSDAEKEAANATKQLSAEEQRRADINQSVANAQKDVNSSLAQARSGISMAISQIKNFNGTKKDEKKLINELNEKYSDQLGYYKSLAEWQDVLTKKGEDYCKVIEAQAKAQAYANLIGQISVQLDSVKLKMNSGNANDETLQSYLQLTRQLKEYENGLKNATTEAGNLSAKLQKGAPSKPNVEGNSKSGRSNSNTDDFPVKNPQSIDELTTAISYYEKKLNALKPSETAHIQLLVNKIDKYKAAKRAIEQQYEALSRPAEVKDDPKTYEELSAAISYYEKKLKQLNPAETEQYTALSNNIKALKDKRQAIDDTNAALARPKELNTLQDIDDELKYQQNLRAHATADNLAGIDANIKKLTELKRNKEEQAHVEKPIDQISTYEELDNEIAFYEERIKHTTGTVQAEALKQKTALEGLRTSWDEQLNKPGDISKLKTMKELDNALSYYQTIQSKQTGDELENTQRTIDAITKKREVVSSLTELPSMETETAKLGGLTGKKLRMELEVIGLDGVQAKIKKLQSLLKDGGSNITDKQRTEIQKLIGTYGQYENTLKKSSVKFNDVWGNIKGVKSGVDSMTKALKGNGTAWEKSASLVDGALQVYEGVSAIVKLIKMLTSSTQENTIMQTVNTETKATAAAADITGTTTALTNSAARTAATHTETTADVVGTTAKVLKAHASIPWVGIAIGAGMVAAMLGIMMGIPKFANGGIAYGPTLGLFGEYSGASNNPEVVAPLDKLQSILGITNNAGVGGKVEFKIKGRKLVGILERENNRTRRV